MRELRDILDTLAEAQARHDTLPAGTVHAEERFHPRGLEQ